MSQAEAPLVSVNPANGETLAVFPAHAGDEVERRLATAITAWSAWRRSSLAERGACLGRAAALLERENERWARLMTLEMGKPIAAARAEVEKCAWVCRYYAEHGPAHLAPRPVATDARRSYVRFDPLGPVLAIMPWNFPFWQVFRFAAPALMAGNVGLLKHASNVPQCGLAIEEILLRSGFPGGCFQTLLVASPAVAALIADPRIVAVTLTGSEGAGAAVAGAAGGALKKVVLELGGSDPFLVLPSADIAVAARSAVQARMLNNGQSCIAAKRFLVHREVAAEFESLLLDGMRRLRVGDPLDPEIDVGPLATPRILEDLDRQVRRSVAAGARLLLGGARLERPGNYYAPTVLADPPPAAPVYGEETFGPVATLFRVGGLDEAIALANATSFGLGASAWTRDAGEQERLATELEAGSVFLNGMVKSDPRLPFGGIKRSGFGRELSEFGIREFTNVKTVWVA